MVVRTVSNGALEIAFIKINIMKIDQIIKSLNSHITVDSLTFQNELNNQSTEWATLYGSLEEPHYGPNFW